MKRIIMKDRILNHLKKYGHITSWEAIELYGCTRLSEYIRQIRMNYVVESKWVYTRNRYNDKVKYCEYILEEDTTN